MVRSPAAPISQEADKVQYVVPLEFVQMDLRARLRKSPQHIPIGGNRLGLPKAFQLGKKIFDREFQWKKSALNLGFRDGHACQGSVQTCLAAAKCRESLGEVLADRLGTVAAIFLPEKGVRAFRVLLLAPVDEDGVAFGLAFGVQSQAAPAPLAVQLDPLHQANCLLRLGHCCGTKNPP